MRLLSQVRLFQSKLCSTHFSHSNVNRSSFFKLKQKLNFNRRRQGSGSESSFEHLVLFVNREMIMLHLYLTFNLGQKCIWIATPLQHMASLNNIGYGRRPNFGMTKFSCLELGGPRRKVLLIKTFQNFLSIQLKIRRLEFRTKCFLIGETFYRYQPLSIWDRNSPKLKNSFHQLRQ